MSNSIKYRLLILAAVAFGASGQASAEAGAVLMRAANGAEVTVADVLADAERIPSQLRGEVLGDAAKVVQLASNLAVVRALAAQAEAEGLAADPKVAAALRLARDRVLFEARLAAAAATVQADPGAVERLALADYRANPERFEVPEQIRASHILFRGDDARTRAAVVLLALREPGADFAALAREHSEDPGSGSRGGDLGWFGRGKMVKAFDDAAFALKPGELSGLVESDFGFHIIRLDEHRPAGRKPFDEVKGELSAAIVKKIEGDARTAIIAPVQASLQPEPSAIEAFASARR